MTMIDQQQLSGWVGRDLVGPDGDRIGQITDIYFDEHTQQPEWLAVSTGWFGARVSFVPIAGATANGDDLAVTWDKAHVKAAPHAEPDGALSETEEAALYGHYGMTYDAAPAADTSTDDAMTRSEEELRVGTTRQESGRVRLRKWVETERVATSIPVEREQVRIEREPVDETNIDAALRGPEIAEAEHEVVLHEEHAVAATEVVPKERVRLEKETVVDEEQVEADLRKEQIEVEGDAGRA